MQTDRRGFFQIVAGALAAIPFIGKWFEKDYSQIPLLIQPGSAQSIFEPDGSSIQDLKYEDWRSSVGTYWGIKRENVGISPNGTNIAYCAMSGCPLKFSPHDHPKFYDFDGVTELPTYKKKGG